MSNNLNTGHMISKPVSSLSGVLLFFSKSRLELSLFCIETIMLTQNPAISSWELKKSFETLHRFQVQKKTPQTTGVAQKKKRLVVKTNFFHDHGDSRRRFLEGTLSRAKLSRAKLPAASSLEVIGEALIGNARGTWEDGWSPMEWNHP